MYNMSEFELARVHFSECPPPDPRVVVHGCRNTVCVDVIGIIGAIYLTRTTATPF